MENTSKRRIPGLDGIRAVAACLVLVYHLLPGWGGNGFVGVDVFFVLSGFLITSLLLSAQRRGRFSLRNFWVRRVRRLLPAVAVATIGSAALALLVGGDAMVALPRQVLGSLTATYNWIEIGHGASYFEQASPLLLTNMWSLAVEQQFYLFWPLIVFLLLKASRSVQVSVALAIGAASTAWHAYLVQTDVSRAYMGTDSHLWGLMLGSMLAFVLGGIMTPAHVLPRAKRNAWGGLAWLGLACAIVVLVLPESAMYPWGMVGISLAMVPIIRAMVPDVSAAPSLASPLVAVLDSRPFAWVGERSYGIYLWHWPLMVLLYYSNPLLNPWIAAGIVTLVSVCFAHLSFTYVETPIRRDGFVGWLKGRGRAIGNFGPARSILATIVPAAVVFCAVCAMIMSPPISSAEEAVRAGAQASQNQPAPTPAPSAEPTSSPEPSASPSAEPSPTPTEPPADDTSSPSPAPSEDGKASATPTETAEPTEAPTPDPAPAPATPVSGENVTIIGDSVTVAATPWLQEALPGVVINAEESRSVRVAPGIIASLEAQGQLRDTVVIALSTNATIRPEDTEAILAAIGPNRTLLYVTGYGPPRTVWIPEANAEIARAVSAYPNVRVADWNRAITTHPDYLAGDAVHPRGAAAGQLYAETIARAL